ncbi:ABC transporter permease [Mycobacterium sp. PS03-16]|uniref:ABC transporter permease n=1 Tax=Mycobacterium sp. PS03-16 TaxID=2559611 RepID=UPI0010741651|nr:ABC transporter permease [Mycobacterium sp. PS03-16]TFV59172.1 ABC transporter permease [Mycobacterium sp. PS03-16]
MTLRSEVVKLGTTRSPLWSLLAVVVLSLGFAGVQASVGSTRMPLEPERVAMGVTTFAVPVLLILAALTVTGEFRTGMIKTTFLATPSRTRVLAAKAFVAAVFAGLSTVAMVIASVVLVRVVGTGTQAAELSFTNVEVWRTVGSAGLYAALGAVLAVGLGALVRHSAGVIAILLMLPFVVEPLLGTIPRVGERIGPFLPFANAHRFTEVPTIQTFAMKWGPLGALLYFTAVVGVVFLLATADVNRRDP